MNKKLIAVAVAGVLAAPAVALAQSSVQITGNIKQSFQNIEYPNAAAGRINKSQWRMTDDASRWTIRVKEDLGRGLSVVAVFEQRFAPNTNDSSLSGGETYVGFKSNTLGSMTFGRFAVSGLILLPSPAARTIACILNFKGDGWIKKLFGFL